MPVSELIPIGEGTPQPLSMNKQYDVARSTINNSENERPGTTESEEIIYTTDGTMIIAYHCYDYPEEDRQAIQDGIVNGLETADGTAYTELVGNNVKELPTWSYNCHAFAWYNDAVWINDAERNKR